MEGEFEREQETTNETNRTDDETPDILNETDEEKRGRPSYTETVIRRRTLPVW